MKKLICKVLLVIDVLAILFYTVMAQFIVKVDSVSGVSRDGFGRVLKPTPLLFSSSYLGINEWNGFGWFLVDIIAIIVLISIAYLLFNAISDRKRGINK